MDFDGFRRESRDLALASKSRAPARFLPLKNKSYWFIAWRGVEGVPTGIVTFAKFHELPILVILGLGVPNYNIFDYFGLQGQTC